MDISSLDANARNDALTKCNNNSYYFPPGMCLLMGCVLIETDIVYRPGNAQLETVLYALAVPYNAHPPIPDLGWNPRVSLSIVRASS